MYYDKEYIERKQSELHSKYNERIDSSVIVILLELSEKTEAQKKILEDATKRINDSQKVHHYNFTSNGQAFWYGFGKFGLAAIVLIIAIFIFLATYFPVLKNWELASNLVNRYELKQDYSTGKRTIVTKEPMELREFKTYSDISNLSTNKQYIYSPVKDQYYTIIRLPDFKK